MTNEREQQIEALARELLAARHATLTEWRWDRVNPAKRTEALHQAEVALRPDGPVAAMLAEAWDEGWNQAGIKGQWLYGTRPSESEGNPYRSAS